MKRCTLSLPRRDQTCANLRGHWGCRYWSSLHWWSWQGLEWDDYIWVEYTQYGGKP